MFSNLLIVPHRHLLSTVKRVLDRSRSIDLGLFTTFLRCKSEDMVVKINDVSKRIKPAEHPEYVPRKYFMKESWSNKEMLKHLRWMLQKDLLGQDIFLMGSPGPGRRNLAMAYLELTGREVEFMALSRDTTEADLKQRREIEKGTANYHDQSAVRAAKHGRVLILEGVEKVERNVLPILNNLLENREMHLEDGRFLVPSARYDKLLQEHSQAELDRWGLVRVSEEFRVIALGLPSSRYHGYPLDPPLRSRFQARHVPAPTFQEQLESLKSLVPNVDVATLSQLLSCSHALVSPEAINLGLHDFPLDNIRNAAIVMEKYPNLSIYDIIYKLYPYKLFLGKEGQDAVESVFETLGIPYRPKNEIEFTSRVLTIDKTENYTSAVTIQVNGNQSLFYVPAGSKTSNTNNSEYVETSYQSNFIGDMMISHSSTDFCIVGPRGCGKSRVVEKLADLLRYEIEPIVIYQDMTSRDLIQQRTTLPSGDTVWKNSPLVVAALDGKMAVLDGIHRLHPSTLAIIHRLVQDRELQLHDGKRILRHDRYDEVKEEWKKSDSDMEKCGLLRMHPSFRLIALAEAPYLVNKATGQWLNSELLSLFSFHVMRPLDKSEEIHIMRSKYGEPRGGLSKIIELAHMLRSSSDPTLESLAGFFSTRQLLRIAARASKYPKDDPYEAIQRACLARFLPALAKQALEESLKRLDIRPLPRSKDDYKIKRISLDEERVTIGETTVDRYKTRDLAKVPDILFYDVPQHLKLLEVLMQDLVLGQNILLVGNQGVGKNKIVDRLLQLMNRPREYIQLHRDTTVQSLTLQPILRDGLVAYEDSPLVQAVRLGHVLVIDEADKAPTRVTSILKTLAESGEMIMSDGRRIVPITSHYDGNESTIPINPDFRMIVLANRPGFPFLGNDFFGALGDLFSTHSVDNPSFESEIHLLRQYAPDVDENIVYKLVKAFGELRSMADQGLVAYPYSTREVVNIVKHLQKFPDEPLATVVRNVFDFDRYSSEIFETLVTVLHKHGIPIGTSRKNVALAKEFPLPKVTLAGTWNVSSDGIIVPVQEKFIKLAQPSYPSRGSHKIDRIDSRSDWFTEMESQWQIPMSGSSRIGAIAVSGGLKADGTDNEIHVLTTNPISLFSMKRESEEAQETAINGLMPSMRTVGGHLPKYSMAADKLGNLLIHEGITNSLLVMDLEKGIGRRMKNSSFVTSASEKLAQAFRNESVFWRMSSNLLARHNIVILYTPRNDSVEVINLESMSACSMSLPCKIDSILPSSRDKWLVQDVEKKMYILEDESGNSPCPNILRRIEYVPVRMSRMPDTFEEISGTDNFNDSLVSKALLGKEMSSSSGRILASDFSYASLILGFLSAESNGGYRRSNEIHTWPRKEPVQTANPPIITEQGQIIRTVKPSYLPADLKDHPRRVFCSSSEYFEVVDPINHNVKYFPIPEPIQLSATSSKWLYSKKEAAVHVAQTPPEGFVTVDAGGCVRLWQTAPVIVDASLKAWFKIVDNDEDEHVQLTKERYSGFEAKAPKHGKVDENNEPHVGGNTWAGGTGGRDTAGLGGKGGPYRLDAGHTVHQLSDDEKNAVPEEVKKAAREMGQRAFAQRLRDIRMSEYDDKVYSQFSDAVAKQTQSLRVILESLEARSKEREWLRHQTCGELDDTKLIEGLTGEKTIYRRRAEREDEEIFGTRQFKPKRLKVVVDVSGSMYRFNGYDGRLDREMEACVMVMEAFAGYEEKIKYDIVGHSGDDYNISFVDHDQPPGNNKQRLQVIKTMHAHSQFCSSGDNTLEASQHAISSIAKDDSADESIVVVLSDANLERYGISPGRFAKILASNSDVNAYAIFIGSLGDEATRLMKSMPAGRAFVCMDLREIPRILQQIFTASVLNTRSN